MEEFAGDGGPLPTRRVDVSVCGESGVGKSALVRQFVSGLWIGDTHRPTIGMAYEAWNGFPADARHPTCEVQLRLWDLGGEPRYAPSRASAHARSDAFVYVFDVRRRDTFEAALNGWQDETQRRGRPGWLIGTHTDCGLEYRQVSNVEGQDRATEVDLMYAECACSDGDEVHAALEGLIEYAHTQGAGPSDATGPDWSDEVLETSETGREQWRCLCFFCK